MFLIEEDYNKFEINNKEYLLIEKTVRTTIQIVYDKGLFDNYDNADEVLKTHLLFGNTDRRRFDLQQSK